MPKLAFGKRRAVSGLNELTAGTDSASDSRRREMRTMVIKSGKICFGNSVVDCTMLDVSPNGARARTAVVVPMPDTVTLRFAAGSAYVARIQWARGTEVGFAFENPAPIADGHPASLALSAFNALPQGDLSTPMRLLRSARFFDDPALANAAEEAEAAYAHFKTTLRQRINFSA